MTGRVHSVQSLGAVDGPGLRYVIFMQGCPLRCAYCHNPDTWKFDGGTEMTTDELVSKVLRFKSYFGKDGGVTVSGGEPLLQAAFVTELFKKLKQNGVHTALDTSCSYINKDVEALLGYTDLVLADLKFTSEEDYKRYVKGDYNTVRKFLDLTQKLKVPIWIRNVVVPGINDSKEALKKVKEIAESYSNLKKIEWLPFANLCQEKYDGLGIEFPFAHIEPTDKKSFDELINSI